MLKTNILRRNNYVDMQICVSEDLFFSFLKKLTNKDPCPGPTGLFQRNTSILQCPVDTPEEQLLLRVHLFHFTVTDAKIPVIKLVEAEDVDRNKGQVRSNLRNL